jgi:5'-nucleotidase
MLGAMALTVLGITSLAATAASAQYVPGNPGIIVNPPSVQVGGTITVQGTGCPAGSHVVIKVGDTTVGDATASNDSDGSFTVTITLPPSIGPGQYLVHALCGDLDLTAVLSVTALATTTTVTATLPVTGTDSGTWVKVAVVLVAVGGLLVLAARRRRALV